MRIFFTTPYRGKSHYQAYIDDILSVLQKHKAKIVTPEDAPNYRKSLEKFESEGFKPEQAHYAFITRGIAEADIVIVEASHESFRVGHEVTLALLYGKPTLVVSQHTSYAEYLTHELLTGVKYTTKRELRTAIRSFLFQAKKKLLRANDNEQTIGEMADALHMAALSPARNKALNDIGEFGMWARLAEKKPEKAYSKIQRALGSLPVSEPWSVFASIYNEDSPDFITRGTARFVNTIFAGYGIRTSDPIADAATGTGAVARNLAHLGYGNISAFDISREMLSEAFRLCAGLKNIKILEADLASVRLPTPVKGISWIDYSSNFALDSSTLRSWLQNLLKNITPNGCLVFDIRTITGWQVSFYNQKVTTFATDNFQRIWVNMPDYEKGLISFDIFIRARKNGLWGEWQREQMTERMWTLAEVKEIASTLPNGQLEAVYGDGYSRAEGAEEPGLAYLVIKKI